MKVSEHIRQAAAIPGLTEKMWFHLWQPGKGWVPKWLSFYEVVWYGKKSNVMTGMVSGTKGILLGYGILVPENTPVGLKQSVAKLGYKQDPHDKYMYLKRVVVPLKKVKTVDDLRGLIAKWRAELIKTWPLGLAIYKATYKKPKWSTRLKQWAKVVLPWLGLTALVAAPALLDMALGEADEAD